MSILPSAEDPLWNQMEEDVADERWPVPSLFGWLGFWYRGSRNELHRRGTFLRLQQQTLHAVRPWKQRPRWLYGLRVIALIAWFALITVRPSSNLAHAQWSDSRGQPFLLLMAALPVYLVWYWASMIAFAWGARRYARSRGRVDESVNPPLHRA